MHARTGLGFRKMEIGKEFCSSRSCPIETWILQEHSPNCRKNAETRFKYSGLIAFDSLRGHHCARNLSRPWFFVTTPKITHLTSLFWNLNGGETGRNKEDQHENVLHCKIFRNERVSVDYLSVTTRQSVIETSDKAPFPQTWLFTRSKSIISPQNTRHLHWSKQYQGFYHLLHMPAADQRLAINSVHASKPQY
jgi:hypothetical protein